MKCKEDYGIEPYFGVSILILAHTDINVPNVKKDRNGNDKRFTETF